jgi:glycerophosphoryl diester phosphodiesterase
LAHAAGLVVHPYTFRAENEFLPTNLKGSTRDSAGGLGEELRAFLAAGIDGFFVDHPDIGVAARDRYCQLLHSQ